MAVYALVKQMIKRQKYAVCRYCSKGGGSSPCLYALLPQEEKGDRPCGFHMVRQPYKDDLRSHKVPETCHVDEAITEKFQKLISNFTFRGDAFDARDAAYRNPHIQKHWTYVETFALDERDYNPPDADFVDMMVVDGQYKEPLSAVEAECASLVAHAGGVDPPKAKKSTGKRKGVAAKVEGEAKKAKKSKAKGDDEPVDIEKIVREGGNLSSLSKDLLKSHCAERGIKVSGSKAVLAERLSLFYTGATVI